MSFEALIEDSTEGAGLAVNGHHVNCFKSELEALKELESLIKYEIKKREEGEEE